MNNIDPGVILIVCITLIAIVLLVVEPIGSVGSNEYDKNKELMFIMEESYFEGQKDALKGFWKVKFHVDTVTNDTCFYWFQSPWQEGYRVEYDPQCNLQ